MNQVGDILTFSAQGTAPGSVQPVYIWKFWDASVQVSEQNTGAVTKRLNLGGNPAETANVLPYVLPFQVEICNREGSVAKTVKRQVAVNNPPTVYGAPTVTPNNQAFPFSTQVKVTAYDLEDHGVDFLWYYGDRSIGGHDVKGGAVPVAAVYYGTLIGANRNSYTSTLTTTVYGAGTVLVCKMVDGDMGTRLLTVPLLGYDPMAPQFSVAAQSNSLTVDASSLPSAVIAPGQQVKFVCYGYDPEPGAIVYTWSLYGSNGWTQPAVPIVSHGNTQNLFQGSSNDFSVSIEDETGDGLRTAQLTAVNSRGLTARTAISVFLTQNSKPIITGIDLYDARTNAPIDTISMASAGTIVKFVCHATSANAAVLYYQWDLTTPDSVFPNYTLYGASAYVDVTYWPSGNTYTALGFCRAIDKYGMESVPFALPDVRV